VLCVLALACLAVTVYADSWGPYGECSRVCDGGIATRTCMGLQSDCPGVSAQICGTTPCQNCTLTSYYAYGSQCSQQCGGGTYWMAYAITQQPGIGGTPCPQTNFTFPCNTYMCYETIMQKGFFFWGPFTGPGPLSYTISRYTTEVDVYLFTQENFVQYQYDAARAKPFQTNYVAIISTLDVETVKSEGPIALDPNTNYYLVVDHTLIGAAQGTTNANGQQVFLENRFDYTITGLNPGPGYNSAPYASAAPLSAAASLPLLGALIAALAAFVL